MKRSHEAWRCADLFDCGFGHLVVSRFKADGRVEAGFFLLDVFCLGVKEAGFHHFSSMADYQEGLIDRLFPNGNPVRMTPEAARKLTDGAISYAKGLGFSPAADYKKASRVFGGITTANCDEQFVFGKNGKPLYTQGLLESPASVERILRVLEASCGEGGYDYILAADSFELFDGEEENVQDTTADPFFRAGLERMADGLRASQPGIEVRINPLGRQRVSDMICQVAELLLESAPDYESKEMIIKLTTTAWNFTLIGPVEQEKMLAEVADRFPGPECMAIFNYLVRRKALLFPDDRLICKFEMEPALDNDIELRVASVM
jgi:hypothetical protein